MGKKQLSNSRWFLRLLATAVLFIGLFSLLSISPQPKEKPFTSKVNDYLVNKGGLTRYKLAVEDRILYQYQGIISVTKHPLFGIGPNNFLYASMHYNPQPFLHPTESAHNIFLEILVGQGSIGLIIFAILLFLLFKNSAKNGLYFSMVGILINFQTDYTYQIYSFLLLFFVIGASISTDKIVVLKYHRAKKSK